VGQIALDGLKCRGALPLSYAPVVGILDYRMGESMRRLAGPADFSAIRSFVSSSLFPVFLLIFTLSARSSAERDSAVPT